MRGPVLITPAAFDEVAPNLGTGDGSRAAHRPGPDHSVRPATREIFHARLASDKRRQARAVIAAAAELQTHGMLAQLGAGQSYLCYLANAAPTAENALHYARIVREKSTL